MEILLFNSPQFGNVRTAGTPEEPLFCLADICRALELQTGATRNRLDQRGVSLVNTPTSSGVQPMVYINEKNLYRVIMRSDKPQAEDFQDWVCGEVLPTIRKTGGYIQAKPEDTPEEIMAKAVILANKTIELQKQRLQALAEENKKQQALLEEQKPKVVFADAIVGGKTNILIRDLAKLIQQNGYEIGEKRLFIWLRENKYLTISNMPMQRYVEMGLFFVDEGSHSESGVMKCHFTTKVTPKGQQYFVNKFLGSN